MTDAVGGVRGADVVAVGEVEDGQPLIAEERHDHHGVFPGGAQAVHGDHPGLPVARHEPGGQRPQFSGDVDVGAVEAERVARVADVHLGGQAHPRARLEGAVGDPLQTADDRVRRVRHVVQEGADDGVAARAGEAVGAGPQRGEAAGEGDPPGAGGVHREPGVARQRPVGRGFEDHVAGVPAGRHRGRAGTDHRGGGCCRGTQTHPPQCGRAPRPRPVGGSARVTAGGPAGGRPGPAAVARRRTSAALPVTAQLLTSRVELFRREQAGRAAGQ